MKFAVVVLALVAAAQAQFPGNRASAFASFGKPNQQPYRQATFKQPFNSRQSQPTYKPYKQTVTVEPVPVPVTFTPVVAAPVPTTYSANAKYYNDGRSANVLKYGNEINPDGSYNYFYETDNGIAAQEQGSLRGLGGNPPEFAEVVQGSFSYTSPEGLPVAISYVADENGYQPSGSVLPTPPPIPPQIARALEYIARTRSVQK